MKKSNFLTILIAILVVFNLSGCGGASGDGTRADANPIVVIDWPTRTRGIDAPSSALSANIVLRSNTVGQADNTLFALRSSNLSAHSQAYTLPAKSKLGQYTLKIVFRSGTTETSQGVGLVNVPVKLTSSGLVNPNGSPMGKVAFDHLIDSVTIAPNQTVGVGGILQLTATPRDKFTNPVVVSPGSFNYKLRSGAANMSVAPDGVATGIAVGSALVYATVDTVQSPDASVNVVTEIRSTVAVASNDLAYDPVGNLLWSTVGNVGTNANSIVGINPATGLIARAIPLGVEPNLIAITDNGEFAYVTIPADGTTRRINLATGANALTIPTGGGIVTMTTVPATPNTVLVGVDPTGGVNVSAWDNAVRRANTGAGGNFIHMASPTVMYGNGGDSLFTCILAPGEINWTAQDGGLITRDFVVHNGLLIDEAGHVVNPITKTLVAQLSQAHFLDGGLGIASSVSDNRAYNITWTGSGNKQILTYELTTYSELPQSDAGLGPGPGATDLTACGNHTVAFRDFSSGNPNTVYIVRGLP